MGRAPRERFGVSTRLQTRLQVAGGDPWPASRTSETIDARNAGEGKRSSVAAAERKDGSEIRDKKPENGRELGK